MIETLMGCLDWVFWKWLIPNGNMMVICLSVWDLKSGIILGIVLACSRGIDSISWILNSYFIIYVTKLQRFRYGISWTILYSFALQNLHSSTANQTALNRRGKCIESYENIIQLQIFNCIKKVYLVSSVFIYGDTNKWTINNPKTLKQTNKKWTYRTWDGLWLGSWLGYSDRWLLVRGGILVSNHCRGWTTPSSPQIRSNGWCCASCHWSCWPANKQIS